MGYRQLPNLETRAVVGPALATAENIKQQRRTGQLSELTLQHAPERFRQESRQRGLTARATEQGIQTREQLTRQAEKRFSREQIAGWLNIGLSSLPNVRSREEHNQWLSWMHKENEVPLELLPILPEGMSPEQYDEWQKDYLNRAAKLKQDYELEKIKARTEGAVEVAETREKGAMERLKYQLMNGQIGAKPLSEGEISNLFEEAGIAYNNAFAKERIDPETGNPVTDMKGEIQYELDPKAPDREKWMVDFIKKRVKSVRRIGKGEKTSSWKEYD